MTKGPTYPIEAFLGLPGVTIDVRSPGEFAQGHIPGAVNLPLFSNEERAVVGTIYKQQGQKEAISQGLQIVGPKLAMFVQQASKLADGGQANVYCWRGGMRSGAMAWLLGFSGLKTTTLQKGYKAFRTWVLKEVARPRKLIVIGGMTGSGKTAMLGSLKDLEQVLDLEALANHRGSSYGKLGITSPQPTTEQFENEIAWKLSRTDPSRPLWVEDESRLIGSCHIPSGLYVQMQQSPLVILDVPIEERMQRLKNEYGSLPQAQLTAATEKIGKHLGSQRKTQAINAIEQGNIDLALEIILKYYDAAYTYSIKKRQTPILNAPTGSEWADFVKNAAII